MKLKDLKEWVNKLPEELLEFDVVSCEENMIDEKEDIWGRMDKPVIRLDIDESNKEALMYTKVIKSVDEDLLEMVSKKSNSVIKEILDKENDGTDTGS